MNNDFWKKHWFKIAGIVIVLAVVGVIAYQTLGQEKSPYAVQKAAPDFQLKTPDGKTATLSETNGKVRLVYFFWATCPDVCSPTTYILSQVQDELKNQNAFGEKTAMYSISFDPERDTPEKLKEFSARFHADPAGWTFLNGSTEKGAIDLAGQYGVGVFKDKDGNFTHTNAIFLVDKKGNIRHYYAGSDLDLDKSQIVKDMLVLAKEK